MRHDSCDGMRARRGEVNKTRTRAVCTQYFQYLLRKSRMPSVRQSWTAQTQRRRARVGSVQSRRLDFSWGLQSLIANGGDDGVSESILRPQEFLSINGAIAVLIKEAPGCVDR